MVHSNGTRFESHRFRIERTGSRKYSGRSSELRDVSAAGEQAARRAKPTSGVSASRVQPSPRRGAPPVAGSGGGQSAAGLLELLPPGPVSTEALTPTTSSPDRGFAGFGLCASGQTGK